jgi:hypothetical protein
MLFDVQIPAGAFAAKTKFRVHLHTFKGDEGNSHHAPYTYQASSYTPYFDAVDNSGAVAAFETTTGTDITLFALNYYATKMTFTTPVELLADRWTWIRFPAQNAAADNACEYTSDPASNSLTQNTNYLFLHDPKNNFYYIFFKKAVSAAATFTFETFKCPVSVAASEFEFVQTYIPTATAAKILTSKLLNKGKPSPA